MKKFVAITLAVLTLLLLGGCKDNVRNESLTKDDDYTTEPVSGKALSGNKYLPELQALGDKVLEASARISENEIALAYIEYDDTKGIEAEMPVQFAVYNMEVGAVVAQSEEYMFNCFEFTDIKAYGNGFYLHNSKAVFVFNKQCELVKEIPLPVEEPAVFVRVPYTVSENGEKCIYEDNRKWYISNIDGTKKTEIFANYPKISASEVFFTSESDIVAYIGQKLPEGEGEGVDCYGFCNIKTGDCTYILADNIYAEVLGDNMIIQERAVDNGKIRSEIVTVYNPVTGETNEIRMNFDDREEYFLWSDSPEYIISVHTTEDEHSVKFNIYKNYKQVKTVEYEYPKDDFIDKNADIYFSSEEEKIIVGYYSNEFSGDVFLELQV